MIFYIVHIKNNSQLNHVLELLSAGISFCQVSKVVHSDRENFGTAAKVGCTSLGEASNFLCLACAIGLQAMVEIMQSCWAFFIKTDKSNDEDEDPHLDLTIRFPSVLGYDGEAKIQHVFSSLSDYSVLSGPH